MAAFLSPLRCEKIGDRRWLLTDDLYYRTDLLDGVFLCSRGFQTNFASIPRWFWAIWPPVGAWDQAATIHDAGYGHALMTPTRQRVSLTKDWSDRLFLEAMRASGVGWLTAHAMYLGVHLGGNPDAHPLAAHAVAP